MALTADNYTGGIVLLAYTSEELFFKWGILVNSVNPPAGQFIQTTTRGQDMVVTGDRFVFQGIGVYGGPNSLLTIENTMPPGYPPSEPWERCGLTFSIKTVDLDSINVDGLYGIDPKLARPIQQVVDVTGKRAPQILAVEAATTLNVVTAVVKDSRYQRHSVVTGVPIQRKTYAWTGLP
jgi:hypothetical protein